MDWRKTQWRLCIDGLEDWKISGAVDISVWKNIKMCFYLLIFDIASAGCLPVCPAQSWDSTSGLSRGRCRVRRCWAVPAPLKALTGAWDNVQLFLLSELKASACWHWMGHESREKPVGSAGTFCLLWTPLSCTLGKMIYSPSWAQTFLFLSCFPVNHSVRLTLIGKIEEKWPIPVCDVSGEML